MSKKGYPILNGAVLFINFIFYFSIIRDDFVPFLRERFIFYYFLAKNDFSYYLIKMSSLINLLYINIYQN